MEKPLSLVEHLSAGVNAAGAGGLVLGLRVGGARIIGVSTSGATAVKLDAVTLAGDTPAIAGAGWGAWGGVVVIGAGARGSWGRWVLIDGDGTKASGELVDGGTAVGTGDVLGLVWLGWLWALDLRLGERATLGDLDGELGGGGLAGWDIKDVQLTTSGGLLGGGLAGVVRDVVSIDDVVVPVAGAELDSGGREAESSLPAARDGVVGGQGQLSIVVVPRAKELDLLNVLGSAESEGELNGRHSELLSKILGGFKKGFS